MYGCKLCMGTNEQFGIPVTRQIQLFRQAGFEGVFTEWSEGEDIAAYRQAADEAGMQYVGIHAPFGNAAKMWESPEAARPAVEELLACLRDCEKYGVPVMIVHAYIGFADAHPLTYGLENFRPVAEAAGRAGVRIALENTEGEIYLERLMTGLAEYENVGFCWDSGHEMCYNRGQDMLGKYGGRLFFTHLNDNLGIRDYGGAITPLDDLHLLPFDGIADWQDIARRLARQGLDDYLTFELNTESKPGRHENDKYANMPIEAYIAEAYARACRVAALFLQQKAAGKA